MNLSDKYQNLISITSEFARLVEIMGKLGGWKYLPVQDKNRLNYLKGKIIQIEAADKIKKVKQVTIFQ